MTSRNGRRFFGGNLQNALAIAIAVVLFSASFPNLLFKNGLSFVAWFAFIPVFFVVRRSSLGASFFWGALYGYAAYGVFNYWLSVFHPLAGLIVGLIYLVYFTVLFPLLKLAQLLFPRRGYLVQWALWLAYEYLRTTGFLAYAYGISGYTQWQVLPVIQLAAVFGVWGVSALVVFPSAYLSAAFADGIAAAGGFFKREKVPGLLWVAALLATLVFGFTAQKDYTAAPVKRIALIQHNTDPWQGGIATYRENFETLKRLSLQAVAQQPPPDLVVWSETAFVPRIYWHVTYRDDEESYLLVKDLLDFLAGQQIPYVLGNDDGRREVAADGSWQRVDYNAVMLFEPGKESRVYRKLHLVPFTEHFPYEKQMPFVYKALKEADTHFWEKGTEATVFEAAGVRFSTPICFEDTFGYLSRDFTRRGAQLIVNLTNDAWAASLPAQMQHAGMAVFRAVENRRSLVRSTASGQTCAIDPYGRVLAMAEPFTQTALTVTVPIVEETTLYTRYGDFLGLFFVLLAAVSLVIGTIRRLWDKKVSSMGTASIDKKRRS